MGITSLLGYGLDFQRAKWTLECTLTRAPENNILVHSPRPSGGLTPVAVGSYYSLI